MNINNILRVGLLLTAASAIGFGQVAEFGVSGGVQKIHSKDLGSGYSFDDGWKLAFRLTLNSWTFAGQEFGYAYNRTTLNVTQGGVTQKYGGMAIHQGFYNFLLYGTPEGKIFRPFVTGGGHFSNFVPPGASAQQGQGETKFGVNYGGGLKVRVSEKYLIRFDLRQFLNSKPFGELRDLPGSNVGGTFRQTEASVGFAFVM